MEGLVVKSARVPDPLFWKGKRVLLTGHTGFKGSWLTMWLHRLGADVTGISLAPLTQPNLFGLAAVDGLCTSCIHDVRDAAGLKVLVEKARPEVAFHLAAQPLVRKSYREPIETFSTNVGGTANVLEAMRGVECLRSVVMVTSDKVYKNLDQRLAFREADMLGGQDPYSASKAAAEIIISSYRDSFFSERGVPVASARAGNVIGGGDWSEDRLLPDVMRAWQAGDVVRIRRPEARRPWQHVLDPLGGYLVLAEALWERPELAEAYNFGPTAEEALPVRVVVEHARSIYGEGEVEWGDGSEGPHEDHWLALNIDKSRDVLSVEPRWNASEAIGRTVTWYRSQRDGENARSLCEREITAYQGLP